MTVSRQLPSLWGSWGDANKADVQRDSQEVAAAAEHLAASQQKLATAEAKVKALQAKTGFSAGNGPDAFALVAEIAAAKTALDAAAEARKAALERETLVIGCSLQGLSPEARESCKGTLAKSSDIVLAANRAENAYQAAQKAMELAKVRLTLSASYLSAMSDLREAKSQVSTDSFALSAWQQRKEEDTGEYVSVQSKKAEEARRKAAELVAAANAASAEASEYGVCTAE